EYAVKTVGLTKIYGGRIKALDGVDLNVESGKVFALLGPNGAGKTTLMRILTTQIKPTSGEAYVFGLSVVREGAKVREMVSYVPQEMSVWTDISGYENLLIYAKIYGIPPSRRNKLIWEALENMGLSEFANNLVKTYSGGMIRRLECACALLTRPKILFLDEPTIGLDPSARKAVWERLSIFRKENGATIFFNTHYMDEADLYADEIAIINRGRIVALGTPESLKHSLGGEIISLEVEDSAFGSKVLEAIKGLDVVSDIIMGGNEVNIVSRDAEHSLPEIMDILRLNGVSVRRVSITKPTLDDVFLKYAGVRLEPVAAGRISEVRHVRSMIRRG
ncbi:MAG: ATP-binding cassette domain-containing protein, partial [Candidatus Bathyarchaeia archaeon]